MTKAFISGCAGLTLTEEEIVFFRTEDPWGLILFARNIDTPAQVSRLTQAFRYAVGRDNAPVLVDQEGGRVQRLKPPNWPKYPAPKLFGDLYKTNNAVGLRAAFLGAQLIASDLIAVGINIDCAPCLDIRFPETVDAIGDRALSSDPEVVAILGQAMINGALAGGVLPVVKHLPGHGRAMVDSHLVLPKVDAEKSALEKVDFVPFRALSDVALGMTAHLLYENIDKSAPGTQSRRVIEDIIRTEIGFDGCLMSDDISMKALGGDVTSRSSKILEAGCDLVLHCNGDMDEMKAVAVAMPELADKAKQRCDRALAQLPKQDVIFDRAEAWNEFKTLTGWSSV
ncbi:MAG: beta-N-acetylhexosaminidase [Roseibium sp.]